MPSTIDPFDIDTWLTEAAPPQRSVTVYGRGDLIAQLEELAAHAPAPGDERLGGSIRNAELDSLRAKIEASALTLHVRGLLNEEHARLLEEHTKGEEFDADGYEHAAISACVVQPPMSIEQVRRLHTRIGEGQWMEIAGAVRRAGDEPVDVPLSRLGSESTPTS